MPTPRIQIRGEPIKSKFKILRLHKLVHAQSINDAHAHCVSDGQFVHGHLCHHDISPCFHVSTGILNAVGWIGWCIYSQKRQGYVWKAFTSIILVGLCLSLEVLDFPPLAWVLDAHSLWHAGTAPLTLLWYRYVLLSCVIIDVLWFQGAASDFQL